MSPSAHDAPSGPSGPEPLTQVRGVPPRSAAEEARTLLAGTTTATLATLSDDGSPWASLVSVAALPDGSPVLCVSTLAEHGRNLERDGRSSVVVADPRPQADVLATGRVTLAGRCVKPTGDGYEPARRAYVDQVKPTYDYVGYGDFSVWVLEVQRVRWVGGYGRMATAEAADYTAAAADPCAPAAPGAVAHLNEDHADALLDIARAHGGFPDATAASCQAVDRYGLDLALHTPRGRAWTRVAWIESISAAGGLRRAAVELTRAARAAAVSG